MLAAKDVGDKNWSLSTDQASFGDYNRIIAPKTKKLSPTSRHLVGVIAGCWPIFINVVTIILFGYSDVGDTMIPT